MQQQKLKDKRQAKNKQKKFIQLQPRDHHGKFVKFPELEIKLTPHEMRQHMRLELKYESMKQNRNKQETPVPEPSSKAVVRRGRPRLIDRPKPKVARLTASERALKSLSAED